MHVYVRGFWQLQIYGLDLHVLVRFSRQPLTHFQTQHFSVVPEQTFQVIGLEELYVLPLSTVESKHYGYEKRTQQFRRGDFFTLPNHSYLSA